MTRYAEALALLAACRDDLRAAWRALGGAR